MDSGKSMQILPLFESDGFIYWKNRFETYVKSKKLDIWHIIINGDFQPVVKNITTQAFEVVLFERQNDDLKKKLAQNNRAKMVLYNALPKKEYERIFMFNSAKEIWQSLLMTNQGNSQNKDNKIDLLVKKYEQFTIFEEESIDSGFAGFNTIITSLKALDECFSSKNYVNKFLRALHPKWRAKVMEIEESKDSSSLALDELIRTSRSSLKGEVDLLDNHVKRINHSGKGMIRKARDIGKCFRCRDPNHLIGECPKPPQNKEQKIFSGVLGVIVCLRIGLEPDERIIDSVCSKHMTENKSLFSTYKAYDGEHIDNLAFNLLSVSQSCNNKCRVLFTEDGSEITKEKKVIVEESLNVTFDESPHPSKLSPLMDDDVGEEETMENKVKVENNIENETLKV
ncbi:hypothetical protein Tco_0247841 [Tanacetum coccineum]